MLYQTIHVYDANPSSGGSGAGGGGTSGSSGGFASIQAAEYFVDTDPGEGNGTAFQAQDGAFRGGIHPAKGLKCYRTVRWSPSGRGAISGQQ